MSSRPVSSPREPAGGCSVTRGSPVISHRASLEPPHQLERALHRRVRLQRVQVRGTRAAPRPARRPSGCASSCRSRAGRSRVEAVVPLRQPRVVAHDLGLGDLGQPGRLPAGAARPGPGPRARRARAGRTRAVPAARGPRIVLGGAAGGGPVRVRTRGRGPRSREHLRRAPRRGGRSRRASAAR